MKRDIPILLWLAVVALLVLSIREQYQYEAPLREQLAAEQKCEDWVVHDRREIREFCIRAALGFLIIMWHSGLLGLYFYIFKLAILADVHYPLFYQF